MPVLKGRPGWRSSNPDHNVVNALTLGLVSTAGLILGCGTSSSNTKSTTVADKNFLSFYLTSAATSGTSRGMYLRLYITAGAGGEALRAYTTVSTNTPADTVNGAHISLSFGSSAGNVTGLGTAVRATFHVPGRSLTGTCAALKAEIVNDSDSARVGGVLSFIRMRLNTDAGYTNADGSFDDNGFVFDIQGLTAGAAHAWRTGLTAATVNAATTCALRIRVGSTTYYIPVATATA